MSLPIFTRCLNYTLTLHTATYSLSNKLFNNLAIPLPYSSLTLNFYQLLSNKINIWLLHETGQYLYKCYGCSWTLVIAETSRGAMWYGGWHTRLLGLMLDVWTPDPTLCGIVGRCLQIQFNNAESLTTGMHWVSSALKTTCFDISYTTCWKWC